jgi:hypothetical protein
MANAISKAELNLNIDRTPVNEAVQLARSTNGTETQGLRKRLPHLTRATTTVRGVPIFLQGETSPPKPSVRLWKHGTQLRV